MARDRAKQVAYSKRYLDEHPEQKKKARAQTAAWAKKNRPRMNEYARAYWRKMRKAAIDAYGGVCRCCGEGTYEFLAIDHINGGGNKHHRSLRGRNHLIRLLRQQDYPPGYQVLCHNCNMARGFYGRCPHEGAVSHGRDRRCARVPALRTP